MLPLIEQEVLSHGWLTAEEIVNLIANGQRVDSRTVRD